MIYILVVVCVAVLAFGIWFARYGTAFRTGKL